MFLTCCLLLALGTLKAQTNWTGAVNTDWYNAGNWTAGFPDAFDNVIISDMPNDPAISSTGAVARSIIIQTGATLTVQAGASLSLNNATLQGLLNQGTVDNYGLISIGATSGTGTTGLNNEGTFYNHAGAEIKIDRSNTHGLLNSWSGVFTNAAKIAIGSVDYVGNWAISNVGTFSNDNGGEIRTDRAAASGLFNIGTFTNNAIIIIGGLTSTGNNGALSNSGTFNNVAGEISIDRSSICGFTNNAAGTFTNTAKVTIGAAAAVGSYGLLNAGIIQNNAGEISIDRSSEYGLFSSVGSTFTNTAKITIGAITSAGNKGFYSNGGTFNNNSGGEISIDRSSISGLNNNGGTFSNAGKIVIGAAASAGYYGIHNKSPFNNNTGGEISIDQTFDCGLFNESNTFTNAAKITTGAMASTGAAGILSIGVFKNNAGGEITIDQTTYGLQVGSGCIFTNNARITIGAAGNVNYSLWTGFNTAFFNNPCSELYVFKPVKIEYTFYNQGLFHVNTAGAHTNSIGTILNDGIIEYPQGNPIPRVTNYDIIVKPVTGQCSSYAPALQIGCCNSFTVDGTWYQDEALSLVAGTYNQATNTFTATNLSGDGVYTLYFSISSGCTRTVSLSYTLDDVTQPVITCPANTTVAVDGNCSHTLGVYNLLSKSDNCAAGESITESQSPASGTVLSGDNSVQSVTLTADDGNGNTKSCSFNVTLNDVSKPVISCPANTTIAADGSCSNTIGTYNLASKTDNCSDNITESQNPTSNTILSGHNSAQTVTLTADDGSGNTQSCSFTVTLQDQASPAAVCQNVSVSLNSAGIADILASQVLNSAASSDNCGTVNAVGVTPNTFNCSNIGENTVTLTTNDGHGNTATCTATVTVSDNTPPTTADAGPDQLDGATCGLTTVTLAANTPVVGAGTWSIMSGTGGSFSDVSNPSSTFSGTAGETYSLQWSIANSPCSASTDNMTVVFNQNPTTANAGPDQPGVVNEATLAANTPDVGTGVWSIVSGDGGSFGDADNPVSTFIGTSGTTYTLRWTISNPPCAESTDDAVITFSNVENDTDGDGVPNNEDNCPATVNPNQEDADCDGVGDACDVCPGGDDSVDNDDDGLPDCKYPPSFEQIIQAWKCGNNFSKVQVCHNGIATKCFNYNALAEHLAHGDYIGACDNASCGGQNRNQISGFSPSTAAIFPNPADDEAWIKLSDFEGAACTIRLLDAHGVLIQYIKIAEAGHELLRLDLSNLSAGLYFVQLLQEGQHTESLKLMVEKD